MSPARLHRPQMTPAAQLHIMGRACPVTLVVAVLGGIFLATRAPLSIRLPALHVTYLRSIWVDV